MQTGDIPGVFTVRPEPRSLLLMEEIWSHSTPSETFLNNTLLLCIGT